MRLNQAGAGEYEHGIGLGQTLEHLGVVQIGEPSSDPDGSGLAVAPDENDVAIRLGRSASRSLASSPEIPLRAG
jgi:hypothetical protein